MASDVPARGFGAVEAAQRPITDELSLTRLEAFSDGVFAIAITLLVLELAVPASADEHLLRSLLHEWPAYLAYVTSFLTIGVFWLQHSAVTNALRAADATLYRLNLLVLLFASFLPFPTKLVGEFVGDRDPEQVAVAFYGISLLALDLALTALIRYVAEQPDLARDDVGEETVQAALRRQPSYAFYAAAIAIGYLVPTVGVGLFLAIALYLGVPGRTVHRLLRGGTTTGPPR